MSAMMKKTAEPAIQLFALTGFAGHQASPANPNGHTTQKPQYRRIGTYS